ncbi:callose synthase 3-like isoform X4 [Helianthus annuus]|nr:callose synthase 3-like isoform X4 [Helianthus annuus]XP_035844789.1 callose synthase 3-like isoform X4 [Helianthus annuus]
MEGYKASETGQNLEQVIYKIKLPGPAILGERKPENQNHAIIFTRGEGLQTIDMNQDNYIEEALKMRNFLQEFRKKLDDVRYPMILGLREHIFTGSVSSLAWFMSNQETSFVTIGQRLLAKPLKLFHLTRGGVSKASKIINLSETYLLPRETSYAALNDGRKLCLECLDSSVMDTSECQQLVRKNDLWYRSLVRYKICCDVSKDW